MSGNKIYDIYFYFDKLRGASWTKLAWVRRFPWEIMCGLRQS
jgi:hypothetical protein